MKSLLLALGTIAILQVHAQSWCAPGATWTYNAEMFTDGFRRMTYTHDTLIDGVSAQIIDLFTTTYLPQPDTPHWVGPYNAYNSVQWVTRFEDDVVYLRAAPWDTLYWFGASVGDYWYPPLITDTSCSPLVVTATGTEIVDGLSLTWLDVGGVRVYERLGSIWDMMMYCPNWIIDGPMGMRCYSDQDISTNLTPWGCETLATIREQDSGSAFSMFPNPGVDMVTLSFTDGGHLVELRDAAGRIVRSEYAHHDQISIEVSSLAPGLYITQVDHGPAQRWLKLDAGGAR